MSTQAPLVSIAIQGGGARLAELLVALEVIQAAETTGEIRVASLAGTSAGAIAAAIYACGPGAVTKARAYLQERSPIAARKLLPNSRFGRGLAYWRVLRGQAACGDGKMEDELEKMFRHLTGIKADTLQFSHLDGNKRKLKVIASQVRSRQRFVFHGETQDLLQALSNSAAFPLVLRGYKSIKTNPYVDGGLCENLPAEVLSEPNQVNGNILAITFPSPAAENLPNNLRSYMMELFSTAINNSVVRTLSQLAQHQVLSILPGASTFSFETAFDPVANEARFKLIRLETSQWLARNIAAAATEAIVLPLSSSNRVALSLSADLCEWYHRAVAPIDRHNIKSTLIVTARSMNSLATDTLEKIQEFAPKTEPLPCVRVTLTKSERQALFRDIHPIQVQDPDGKPIDVKVLPMHDPARISDADPLGYAGHLVLFSKVLPPMSQADFEAGKSYKLRYVADIEEQMSPFRTSGKDHILFHNIKLAPYGRIEIALIYPQSVKFHHVATVDGRLATPISNARLKQFDPLVRPEYRICGWEADSCTATSALRIDITRTP